MQWYCLINQYYKREPESSLAVCVCPEGITFFLAIYSTSTFHELHTYRKTAYPVTTNNVLKAQRMHFVAISMYFPNCLFLWKAGPPRNQTLHVKIGHSLAKKKLKINPFCNPVLLSKPIQLLHVLQLFEAQSLQLHLGGFSGSYCTRAAKAMVLERCGEDVSGKGVAVHSCKANISFLSSEDLKQSVQHWMGMTGMEEDWKCKHFGSHSTGPDISTMKYQTCFVIQSLVL